jgi:DNA-binding transcriptional LysR family regulator
MHRPLAWNDLLYVLAVGRSGSLSGGARALGVNHSTVFRRIGKLEDELGVRLFERQRDGYSPTAAGEATIALAEQLDEQVLALQRRLEGEDLKPVGTVRVTTSDTLIPVLVPLLAEFRSLYPAIHLELAVGSTALNLTRRDADLALRATSMPDDRLFGRKLARIAFAVYGSESYIADAGGADLNASHSWIGLDESMSHLRSYRWMEQNVSKASTQLAFNALSSVGTAAVQGLGLALLPCYMASYLPRLVRCTPVLEDVSTDLWLLVHEDLRQTTRVRAIMDFVTEKVTKLRATFEGH